MSMPIRRTSEVRAEVRERARALREKLAKKPRVEELLTPQELADAAPFYFQLQACIKQLKEARLAGGLTLAQVAEKTGLAAETLSRLETGMLTNPTWKTLGLIAAAVGRELTISVEYKSP
jgi:DNA-binding XRE family transcriptional regulator